MKRISEVYSDALERVCMSWDGGLTSQGDSACEDKKSEICDGGGRGANLQLVRLSSVCGLVAVVVGSAEGKEEEENSSSSSVSSSSTSRS